MKVEAIEIETTEQRTREMFFPEHDLKLLATCQCATLCDRSGSNAYTPVTLAYSETVKTKGVRIEMSEDESRSFLRMIHSTLGESHPIVCGLKQLVDKDSDPDDDREPFGKCEGCQKQLYCDDKMVSDSEGVYLCTDCGKALDPDTGPLVTESEPAKSPGEYRYHMAALGWKYDGVSFSKPIGANEYTIDFVLGGTGTSGYVSRLRFDWRHVAGLAQNPMLAAQACEAHAREQGKGKVDTSICDNCGGTGRVCESNNDGDVWVQCPNCGTTKNKPKNRIPYTVETWPKGATHVRYIGGDDRNTMSMDYVEYRGVWLVSSSRARLVSWNQLADHYQLSTDNGATWQPCYQEVEA